MERFETEFMQTWRVIIVSFQTSYSIDQFIIRQQKAFPNIPCSKDPDTMELQTKISKLFNVFELESRRLND